ncbi:MAG: zinc ribbon domain-containing protein [Bacteroidota bacterium]
MPTYDYVCKECGHRFEAFQSMSDSVLTTCPNCNTEALQRLIGAGAGLHFKGSGFYLTDYKKSGASPSGSNSSHSNGNDSAAASNKDSSGDSASKSTGSDSSSTSSDSKSASTDK